MIIYNAGYNYSPKQITFWVDSPKRCIPENIVKLLNKFKPYSVIIIFNNDSIQKCLTPGKLGNHLCIPSKQHI